MATKPWAIVNAQNKVVARVASNRIPAHLEEAEKAGLLSIEYRPRKSKVKREFPYEGTHRL